jgi:hypothetical protein
MSSTQKKQLAGLRENQQLQKPRNLEEYTAEYKDNIESDITTYPLNPIFSQTKKKLDLQDACYESGYDFKKR